MSVWVNDNGTKREIFAIHVNDNGTKRTIHVLYVNDNGTKRTIFVRPVETFAVNIVDTAVTPASAFASATVSSAGVVNSNPDGTIGTWLISGAASDYEVLVSGSGSTPAGSALDTWINCGTSPSWSMSASGGAQIRTFSGGWSLRRAGGATISTGSFSLTANSTGL